MILQSGIFAKNLTHVNLTTFFLHKGIQINRFLFLLFIIFSLSKTFFLTFYLMMMFFIEKFLLNFLTCFYFLTFYKYIMFYILYFIYYRYFFKSHP